MSSKVITYVLIVPAINTKSVSVEVLVAVIYKSKAPYSVLTPSE